MGAAELRLMAALASDPAKLHAAAEPGADPKARLEAIRPDGLTLCGDGHQRIYRVPVTLRECGIRVGGGSSRKLRLNYRTTDAIRRAAVAVVEGLDLDHLDEDSGDPLEGYRSLRQGVAPEAHEFGGEGEEADWIADRAREDHGQLLVLSRTKKYRDAIRDNLEARGLKPRVLEAHDTPSESDPLLLATLHRAKGLEAPRVIIAGRHKVPLRYPGGGDERDRALWDRKERSLLYVGMTRARDWCGVGSYG
jgi:superfamily I DNA/RNA helicase